MYSEDFAPSLIAKMYYIDKIKQKQIADKLNISPMQVSRMLDLAEERGIIQFSVKMPNEVDIALSSKIKNKYGIEECFVIKNVEGLTGKNVVANFAAKYVIELLPPDGVLGVSWGETIYQFANNLPILNYPECTVIQLYGGFYVESKQRFTPADVIMKTRERLNSKYMLLHAPAFVDNKEIKRLLLEDPNNKRVFKLARNANINILGISAFDKNSTTYREGIVNDEDLKEIESKDAIGDVGGVFFDKEGNEIIWSRSDACTGVPISIIQKCKNCICLASGSAKGEILKAVIDKGIFHTVIIDEELAREIV